eukprot:scaffold131110_cov26-Prasinocladus_malaysianus.AAC.1
MEFYFKNISRLTAVNVRFCAGRVFRPAEKPEPQQVSSEGAAPPPTLAVLPVIRSVPLAMARQAAATHETRHSA